MEITRLVVPWLLFGSLIGCSQLKCPAGYVAITERAPAPEPVPAFCVAKYEMKRGERAESSPEGHPWTRISQLEAKAACERLGDGYHLITNPEWMTVAAEIASHDANWSDDSVGAGTLNKGNTNNDPWEQSNNSLPAGEDSSPCAMTDIDCSQDSIPGLFATKRTHDVGGGKVIWDFSGNVWEWVDWVVEHSQRANISSHDEVWYELKDVQPTPAMPESSFRLNKTYDSLQGIGMYYPGHPGFGGAAVRGGYWGRPENSGILALHMSKYPEARMNHVGFRCVFRPPERSGRP